MLIISGMVIKRTEKTSNIVDEASNNAADSIGQTVEELRFSFGHLLLSGSLLEHLDHVLLGSTHHLGKTQGEGREHSSCDSDVELHCGVQVM